METMTFGKAETEYTVDEDGTRITNIPFEKFISERSRPEHAVTVNINENAAGEENSQSINTAIETLADGGVIYIPYGEYKVSTIRLKSNITLFIPKGAKLVSLDCEENLKSPNPLDTAVIFAEHAENVTITGGGTICGSGESYTLDAIESKPLYALKEFNLYTRVIESRKRIRFGKKVARNNIVHFSRCTNILIDNIVLEESAGWTCVINHCSDVEIKNMVIDNHMHVANTDGIDICNSSNVLVSNCFIATGDDAIVLKSPENEIKNVTVEHCVLSSFANCFKIGTETQFAVSDITVRNCRFFLPDGITGGYSGIAIESADGADINNVTIDTIAMDGISAPILIWLGCRFRYNKRAVGSIDNVSISNVNATNTELPSAVTGCKYDSEIYAVKNITLRNIRAYYRDTEENLSVKENVSDSSMNDYPEITRISHIYFKSHELSEYWDLPCYSLFMRYAEGVEYSTYRTAARTCNHRDEFYMESVHGRR